VEPDVPKESVEVADEEVRVLEVGEESEVRNHARDQEASTYLIARRRVNPRCTVIVDDTDAEQKCEVAHVPSGIEKARGSGQDEEAPLQADGNRQNAKEDQEEDEESGA
jgi:hypothetical protein